MSSSKGVGATGAAISEPGYRPRHWLNVRPDGAGAVGTEVEAMLQNGRCPHVFYGDNMQTCFGWMDRVGADTIPRFAIPWWFRTTFTAPHRPGKRVELVVNGVVGAADVWVDGRELTVRRAVQGDFTRLRFDVTGLVHRGVNALALELAPNDPNKMFTLDDVDWNQIPPDNNTGIQFPVTLDTGGPLALSEAHVVQHDNRAATRARLVFLARVTNVSDRARRGAVTVRVTPPRGGDAPIVVRRSIVLAAGARRTVRIQRTLRHPRRWWPYALGGQPLYRLTTVASTAGVRGSRDAESETFGIRRVETRLVGASPIVKRGSRQFLVNGRALVFRGGGWSENLFLHYSPSNTATQIAMMKNLGVNGIRTEGHQMPANFYEQMDRAGILIDAGYQCCDAWQLQSSHLTSRHDLALLRNSARTIAQNLRNHPSILDFSWSDANPTPIQARVSIAAFRAAGFQEPLIASAEYKGARGLGPSGEKEGPYEWVPPSYWYDTSHYNPHGNARTNMGGAWGFDSESSSGQTIPTVPALRLFMSPHELHQLWTEPNANQYHSNYEKGLPNIKRNYGYAFGTLHNLDAALRHRYGHWHGLNGFVEEAQLQNYETQRAQFEAYIAHSRRRHAPSTGLVYWQLNKGWPTLLWDLYNFDFDEAGSFFGAQEANLPLHVLYAYRSGDVAVDDLGARAAHGLSVTARVYDVAGNLLSERTVDGVSVRAQGVDSAVLRPPVPAATKPPTPARTSFVELELRRADGRLVDRNVYWLSTQHDVVNWKKTIGLPEATMRQYASFAQLRRLPRGTVAVHTQSQRGHGPDGSNVVTRVRITNTSSTHAVAFFLRADVLRGTAAGHPAGPNDLVLPVFWSSDDVTLWPGESTTLVARYRRSELHGASPVVWVSGFNIAPRSVGGS